MVSALARPVCLVQPTLFPEASRVDIYEYSTALARLGVETHAIISGNRSRPCSGLTVHETGLPPRNDPWSWLRFARAAQDVVLRLARERNLGVVHLFNPSPATFLLGRRLSRRRERPALVYDLRTGGLGRGPDAMLINAMARGATRFADRLIALTEGVAKRVLPPGSAFTVVPLGVNVESFSPRPARPADGKFVFLYAGTLSRNRRLDRMLAAFAKVRGSHPRAQLRLAGDGDGRPALEALARQASIEGAIQFLGKRDPAELPALLAGADCCLAYVPREPWYEHQPQLKLLEALAMDLPAVAVRTEATLPYWQSLPQDLLTADDPESFARGMTFALEQGSALRNGAFRRAAERHAWVEIARERLVPMYSELMVR